MVLIHFQVNSNKSILYSNYICSVDKLGISPPTLDLVLVFLSALNQFLYHKQTLELELESCSPIVNKYFGIHLTIFNSHNLSSTLKCDFD
jgi:hypothetical protein